MTTVNPPSFFKYAKHLTRVSLKSEGKGGFVRTLDFEKFPNLEDARVTGHFATASSLRWIYASFSTINPATLPRLSVLRLGCLPLCPAPKDPQDKLHRNLQLIKNEVDRIERDFNGAVKLTLNDFPGLEVSDLCSYPHLFLTKPPALISSRYET